MKKLKSEGKKIVHSLIFFYEEAATVFDKKRCTKKFQKISQDVFLLECLIFNKAAGLRSL